MTATAARRIVRIGVPVAAAIALAGCIPSVGGNEPAETARYPDMPPAQSGAETASTLPAAPPAWDTHPVEADAKAVSTRSYTVEPGDSLRRIAAKTGAGALAIALANAIPEPYTIFPGQRLAIPGGRYHVVRRGQTGIAIARAYGIEWSRIVSANGLSEPYLLHTGWKLLIPGAERIGRSSAAERAAAFTLDVDDLVTGSQPAIAENRAPAAPTPSPARKLAATTPVAPPARLVGGFSWPARGAIASRFGPGASGVRNDGIQIAAPVGTPILAAADGVVAYVGNGIAALGGLIILKHGDGWTTVYGNASKLLVSRGQSVKRGQQIAVSGDTGFVDSPGVHFEIRKGRDPVDPLAKLSAGT